MCETTAPRISCVTAQTLSGLFTNSRISPRAFSSVLRDNGGEKTLLTLLAAPTPAAAPAPAPAVCSFVPVSWEATERTASCGRQRGRVDWKGGEEEKGGFDRVLCLLSLIDNLITHRVATSNTDVALRGTRRTHIICFLGR